MSLFSVLLLLAGLTLTAYYLGRRRAIGGLTRSRKTAYHSLPAYYGGYVAIWCAIPALVVFAAWIVFEPAFVRGEVLQSLPREVLELSQQQLGLVYNDIRNLAEGGAIAAQPDPAIAAAAQKYNDLRANSRYILTASLLVVSISALLWALRRVQPQFRARNRVERVIEWMLEIGRAHV